MRPAVLLFAPILLLPYLACTDTPVEPEAEETIALFRNAAPHEPGYYVQIDAKCTWRWSQRADVANLWPSAECAISYYAGDDCGPVWTGARVQTWFDVTELMDCPIVTSAEWTAPWGEADGYGFVEFASVADFYAHGPVERSLYDGVVSYRAEVVKVD